jgi:hypothetical protein
MVFRLILTAGSPSRGVATAGIPSNVNPMIWQDVMTTGNPMEREKMSKLVLS